MQLREGTTEFVGLLMVLALIVVVVVLGNSLVIVAVLTYPKLRSSVNNSFIASLAAADFLLGVTVLPFSATSEAMGEWIFGSGMCTAWLAIDVWMCTASIYHLCVISFDRYLAVAFPLKYPNLMSHSRCRVLILAVWIVSFLICSPPLFGWRGPAQQADGPNNTSWTNATHDSNFSRSATCEVVGANSTGYVIYSSLGSFFVPMSVMVFFYVQVFKAAKKFNNALRTGIIDTKSPDACAGSALRVHRGGPGIQRQESAQSMSSLAVPPHQKRARFAQSKGKLAASSYEVCREKADPRPTRSESDVAILSSLSSASDHSIRSATPDANGGACDAVSSFLRKGAPHSPAAASSTIKKALGHGSPMTFAERKNMRMAFRILNREAKAAKTLAIIVGAFILCWLPFFVLYLVSGFCWSCVPEALFDVFVWVGYFNSALNPVIYAMFSKDYCHAFKKLLRCQLKARKERQKGIINFLTSLYIQGSSSERESLYMTETNLRASDDGREGNNGHPAAT